jgi:hypothetical protein
MADTPDGTPDTSDLSDRIDGLADRGDVHAARLDHLAERLDDHDSRLGQLEATPEPPPPPGDATRPTVGDLVGLHGLHAGRTFAAMRRPAP